MKKLITAVLLLSLLCVSLTGCVQWETAAHYEPLYDISDIESIRIYSTAEDYNYSDPDEPCGKLLIEIPSDQYSAFTEELIGLPFKQHHMILLVPVTYDPNFYYGKNIIKIVYQDGSCELISDIIQRQFKVDEKHSDTTRYSADQGAWSELLRNWIFNK